MTGDLLPISQTRRIVSGAARSSDEEDQDGWWVRGGGGRAGENKGEGCLLACTFVLRLRQPSQATLVTVARGWTDTTGVGVADGRCAESELETGDEASSATAGRICGSVRRGGGRSASYGGLVDMLAAKGCGWRRLPFSGRRRTQDAGRRAPSGGHKTAVG